MLEKLSKNTGVFIWLYCCHLLHPQAHLVLVFDLTVYCSFSFYIKIRRNGKMKFKPAAPILYFYIIFVPLFFLVENIFI